MGGRVTPTSVSKMLLLWTLLATCCLGVHSLQWENSVDLDEDFRLQWNVKGAEVTFEVQVATLGYVGLGFSPNGAMDNADMAIGWVDQGQAFFQVSAHAQSTDRDNGGHANEREGETLFGQRSTFN